MKLPSYKRLFTNNFQEQYRQLMDNLSGILNDGIDAVYNALNNNLTFPDNVYCTIKTINTAVDANGNPPSNGGNSTLSFQLSNTGRVIGVEVWKIAQVKNNNSEASVYPSGGITVSWQQSGNSLIINNITGLNGTYKGNSIVGTVWAITLIAHAQPKSN